MVASEGLEPQLRKPLIVVGFSSVGGDLFALVHHRCAVLIIAPKAGQVNGTMPPLRLGAPKHSLIGLEKGNRPGNTSCPDAPSRHQAVAGFQLCGSNSPMRLAGCVGNRSRMSSR